jgi:hypothetical protein
MNRYCCHCGTAAPSAVAVTFGETAERLFLRLDDHESELRWIGEELARTTAAVERVAAALEKLAGLDVDGGPA